MSFAKTRGRGGSQVLVGGCLVAGLVTLAVPSANAATCTYDGGFWHLQVTAALADTSPIVVKANGSSLQISGVSCALLTDVDTVDIDMSQVAGHGLRFDSSGRAARARIDKRRRRLK